MAIIPDDFAGTWQTFAGHTIHYNNQAARLYRGIHRQVEDEGNTRLDGSHLEFVDEYISLGAAQDAAASAAAD